VEDVGFRPVLEFTRYDEPPGVGDRVRGEHPPALLGVGRLEDLFGGVRDLGVVDRLRVGEDDENEEEPRHDRREQDPTARRDRGGGGDDLPNRSEQWERELREISLEPDQAAVESRRDPDSSRDRGQVRSSQTADG